MKVHKPITNRHNVIKKIETKESSPYDLKNINIYPFTSSKIFLIIYFYNRKFKLY